ncbi:MAG TPA: hypothetical protein VM842_03560, partial [Nitrospira sp.]|nr:hypothetical protein [Nitrospira sp.]
RFRRHEGTYRSIRSVGIPNGSAGEPFIGYMGESFDMTDSQEAEERLQRWSHDLERADETGRRRDLFEQGRGD